jgi:protein-S-isoprenylcysteine O-methyltransferase Ste14
MVHSIWTAIYPSHTSLLRDTYLWRMKAKTLPDRRLLSASSALGILLILGANWIMPLPMVTEVGSWTNFLILLAAVLMVWSLITLGGMAFGGDRPAHLVSHGLYRYSRHPFYLGLILGFLGLSLAFNNWIALGSALFIVVPVQVLRAMHEEQSMRKHFGEEWDYYVSRTAFMIPGLW